MDDKFLTVVFMLGDDSNHDELFDSLGSGSKVNGSVVTGISRSDEMSRVEYLESVLDDNCIDYD